MYLTCGTCRSFLKAWLAQASSRVHPRAIQLDRPVSSIPIATHNTSGYHHKFMDLELRHIHKRFGHVHANDDISVTFHGGRIVGVLGENGAGKSTLMKILSGFQSADSGEILLEGRVASYHGPQAAIASGIGMLQQDPLDVPAFTVIENFRYGQRGGLLMRRRAVQEQLNRLCGRFGFEMNPDAPISSLSIGQRQQTHNLKLLALPNTE